jgi:hypothetical protein
MTSPPIRASLNGRVGRIRTALDTVATRSLALEISLLAALTATAAGVYVWTKAPLYNPPGTIDPWLYTALWTNFDQVYATFSGTYYISRVPWIVPGYLLNEVFDARTASLVLHTTFFLAGGVLFYVLLRRWLGVVAAATGYVALIGSQMYFNAHRWDYQEGAVITFMIATYAFALPRTRSRRLRLLSVGLGGFFAAATVTTRILDIVFLLGLPLLYVALVGDPRRESRMGQLVRDVGAFAIGALVLVVTAGTIAWRRGEEFLFFMPQVRIVRSTSGGYNQMPVDEWLPYAPYYWMPLFVLVFAALVLVLNRAGASPARRALLAATAWLGLLFVPLTLWQFLGSGWLFNVNYYFSSFLVPALFCLAAAVAVFFGIRPEYRVAVPVVLGCVVAVLVPVAWIFRSDSPLRSATGYRDASLAATFVAMVVAIGLILLARARPARAVGVVAVSVAFFAAAYPVNASIATLTFGGSDPQSGALYDVGQKLVGYLRANGYEARMPRFWYDDKEQNGAFLSLQSLYYYAYTFVGIAMPTIDAQFRERFTSMQTGELVLLCGEPTCKGAAEALERGGYQPRLRRATVLQSDDFRAWVRIYGVTDPAPSSR